MRREIPVADVNELIQKARNKLENEGFSQPEADEIVDFLSGNHNPDITLRRFIEGTILVEVERAKDGGAIEVFYVKENTSVNRIIYMHNNRTPKKLRK